MGSSLPAKRSRPILRIYSFPYNYACEVYPSAKPTVLKVSSQGLLALLLCRLCILTAENNYFLFARTFLLRGLQRIHRPSEPTVSTWQLKSCWPKGPKGHVAASGQQSCNSWIAVTQAWHKRASIGSRWNGSCAFVPFNVISGQWELTVTAGFCSYSVCPKRS